MSGIYGGGYAQKACPTCYTVNQGAAAFCVGCGAHFLPVAPAPAPPPAIKPLAAVANTSGPLRPSWSKTQVYGEGYELARRHLEELGARDENINLAVVADTGLPGARSCAMVTERRLIVARMLGTGSPVAVSLLWLDAAKLQWLESPRGVILAFTTRAGQKVTIEGLSATEAQQIVDFAIDHGNRLSIDLSGASTGAPAQVPTLMQLGEQTVPALRRLKTGPLLSRRARPSQPLSPEDLPASEREQKAPPTPVPAAQPAQASAPKQTGKGSLMGAMRNAISSISPGKRGRMSGPLDQPDSGPLPVETAAPTPTPAREPSAPVTPTASIVMTNPAGSDVNLAARVPELGESSSGPLLGDKDQTITEMLRAEGLEADLAPFVPPEIPDMMVAAYAPADLLSTSPNLAPRPRINKPVMPPSTIGPDPVARMRQLRDMFESGLISEEEFAQKKQEILARM